MCQKCEELEAKENLGLQVYTLYFFDGKRIVLRGNNFGDGWNKAQAESETVLYAHEIEWMDRGETDTHRWIPEVNSWLNRKAGVNTKQDMLIDMLKLYPELRRHRIPRPRIRLS